MTLRLAVIDDEAGFLTVFDRRVVRKLRLKRDRLSPGWRYIHTHFAGGYGAASAPPASARRESALAPVAEACA